MSLFHPATVRRLVRGYGFERVKSGRSKLKAVLHRFLPRVVEAELAQGLRMELDLSISRQAYDFYHHEEDEAALQWAIDTFCPPGGVFFDVGANIGFFGLYAMWSRGTKSHFIEPVPRLVTQIQRSLLLNPYGHRGTVYPLAASDRGGSAFLRMENKNDGGHSLGEAQSQPGITVQTERLDRILKERSIAVVDFMKIDAEGHDFQVLEGLGNLLEPNTVKVLYIEDNSQKVCDLLLSKGYAGYLAHRYYIDALRKKIRMGQQHGFYTPQDAPGVNKLWVARQGSFDRLLQQVCRY